MSITTKEIMKDYENGVKLSDIAQKLVDAGELDEFQEAMQVIAEIIQAYRGK